jgi:hypothetical protein
MGYRSWNRPSPRATTKCGVVAESTLSSITESRPQEFKNCWRLKMDPSSGSGSFPPPIVLRGSSLSLHASLIPFPSPPPPPPPPPQQANMDRASQVLAEGIPPGVRNTYRARSEYGKVARSTLNSRALGRRSKEEKDQSQQYLTPCEEKAIVSFLLQMAEFGQPVRIKHLPSFSLQRRSPAIHEQTSKASRQELGSGFRETSSRTQSKKMYGAGLGPFPHL